MRATIVRAWMSSVSAVSLCGLAAFAQSSSTAPTPAETPFVARGPMHRLFIASDNALLPELVTHNALASLQDYGSFTIAQVDARRAGGLESLLARGAQL